MIGIHIPLHAGADSIANSRRRSSRMLFGHEIAKEVRWKPGISLAAWEGFPKFGGIRRM